MLNLDRLRALHAVSAHGSIIAAAERLNVTTSAVSQQLAKLEADIEKERQKEAARLERERQKEIERLDREVARRERESAQTGDSVTDILGDAVQAFGSSAGRSLVRGILGSLTTGKKRW